MCFLILCLAHASHSYDFSIPISLNPPKQRGPKFLYRLYVLGGNGSTEETVSRGSFISNELLKTPKKRGFACLVNLEPTTNQQKYSFIS
jgi:hypothetical protein